MCAHLCVLFVFLKSVAECFQIFIATHCPRYILTYNLAKINTIDISLSHVVLAVNKPLKQAIIHCDDARVSSIFAKCASHIGRYVLSSESWLDILCIIYSLVA